MNFNPGNNEDLDDAREKADSDRCDAILEGAGLKGRIVYEETTGGRWWLINKHGEWVGRPPSQIDPYLKRYGIKAFREDKNTNADLDEAKIQVSLNWAVAYAGPLAGHNKGIQRNNGQLVLVTRSPNIPTPMPGREFPLLRQILDRMLGPNEKDKTDQRNYFYAWLRHSMECLHDPDPESYTCGLAVVLAGDAGCGKSFLKSIIRECFGGRECKPYSFMTGAEKFNKECLGAELWAIDDEQAVTDAKSRSEFGANIKKIVADDTYRIRGMQSDGVNLVFFKRLLICVNREPERLMVLPQLDDDIGGKMSIFLCHAGPMPMETGTREEKAIFKAAIMAELPGFIHWLLYEWDCDKSLVSGRFGARHYHHPGLCKDLFEMSREHTLFNQLNKVLFSSDDMDLGGASWYVDLTSSQLRDALTDENAPLSNGEKNHIPLPSWFGKCMAAIAREMPTRVRTRKSNGKKSWVITKEGREINEALDMITANAARRGNK